jgi:protein involved in polysaccharide export with SLBB domain
MFLGCDPVLGRRDRTLDLLVLTIGCLLWAAGLGCAHQAPEGSGLPMSVPNHEERLGVDDVFEVRVYGEADLSGAYRVSADGTIDFPLAGRIPVVGLNIGEVQLEIVKRLKAGYLLQPQVTVMAKDWNSRKVSVLGQVQRPGTVLYFPNMTIVDAIASAGGFTGIAAKNSVSLRREVTGKVETKTFPVADITEGRSPNVVVMPGDVLVVEERLF